jgi:hypothetical protein
MKNSSTFVQQVGSRLAAGAVVAFLAAGCAAVGPSAERNGAPISQSRAVSFALIGDLGYLPAEEPAVDAVFADLNGDAGLAFAVHLGDLSAPRYGCTDEFRSRRLAQFQASPHPFVFTPGDNDWTDCHEPAVKGGNPLERLATLRTAFFPDGETLGRRRLALARQSDAGESAFAKYRENARWDLGGVTFITLHVPGSNNGLGRTPEGNAEYAERNQANLAWLRKGFEHAIARNSRAVMVLQQANLYPEFPPYPGKPQQPSGYADLRAQLAKETTAFGKPVVLAHGDSHFFRIDKPLSPMRERGKPVVTAFENFTRVETFGSPYHHWVRVTIDADDPSVFTFRQRIVSSNLARRP